MLDSADYRVSRGISNFPYCRKRDVLQGGPSENIRKVTYSTITAVVMDGMIHIVKEVKNLVTVKVPQTTPGDARRNRRARSEPLSRTTI